MQNVDYRLHLIGYIATTLRGFIKFWKRNEVPT